MMNRFVVSSLIVCAILGTTTYGQNSDVTRLTATQPAASVGLKDVFAGKFLVGCAGDVPRGYSDAEQANIKANYNIITPENCMKPQPTHPSEDTYTFTTPDAMVQWCQGNNIKVWGHTLAWHAQTANWFFQGADGNSVTREVAMERLKKHIMTVVGRYKAKIMGWDVVNEAINDRGDWTTENLRNSSWVRAIGPDYLTMAFKWAHEADPNALLFYNDYNIEQGATQNTGKHASSMLLLKRLIKDGAPVNGVGIQGHWHLDTNIADVEKAITDYESLGLKVGISELDVTATGTNSGAFPIRGGESVETDWTEAFQKQAQVYAQLFDIFNRHAKTMSRVTFWGISDRRSWRSGQRPLVFDAQLQPKPAYQAIVDVAQGKNAYAAPDPNFWVFLCFGQSNMESGGRMDANDRTVDKRFQVMADFDNANRGWKKGNWYDAVPPLAAKGSGICMVDYFGRTMVANLPQGIRVGVIKVSVPGCKIELFEKDTFQTYLATERDWMKPLVQNYGGNPYQYLVDMAKLAQKDGVIKGILLHQGESNANDQEWPKKVKGIYDNLIKDLDLKPAEVPFLAGETVNADQGGACAGFNKIMAKLPETLPNSYVVSSAGCTCNPDHMHFNSAGSREFGKRYGEKMLSILGYKIKQADAQPAPQPAAR